MFVIDATQNLKEDTWTKPFGFIAHPRMASQSVRKALFGIGARESNHTFEKAEAGRIIEAGGTVACIIRNPWDTMVSWWSYKQEKPYNPTYPDFPTFQEWLPGILEEGFQTEDYLYYGSQHCNRFIRFEQDIERQLNGCLADCGLPTVAMPYIGASLRLCNYYQDYYTTDLAIQVYRRFAGEIEQWGYKFEDLR